MAQRTIRRVLIGVLVLAPLGLTGCREPDPPDPYDRDLGTDGTVLLPTASVVTIAEIAQGQADWTDLRDPSAAPPAGQDQRGDQPDTTTANAAVEEEIRDLVDEYNEVVADAEASVDDLLDYYVDEQRPALKPVLEAGRTIRETLQALRSELETKKPDESRRIASTWAALETSVAPDLKVDSLVVISDTEVTATMARGSLIAAYRFVIVENEWYLQVPNAEILTQLLPVVVKQATAFAGLLEGLKAGTTSPDEALQDVEAASKLVQALTQPAGSDGGGG